MIESRAAIAECEKEMVLLADDRTRLEAEAAAMRGALQSAWKIITHYPEGFGPGGAVEQVEAALLPDAGKRLLAVVEAAKEYMDNNQTGEGYRKLANALAAWRKP